MDLPLKKELELHNKYKQSYKILDKQSVTMYITKYLKECDDCVGRNNKLDSIRKMLSFLIINKWFLQTYQKFADTVKNKLQELYETEKWTAASEIYHFYLFGKTISGQKENFETSTHVIKKEINENKQSSYDKFEKLYDEIEILER